MLKLQMLHNKSISKIYWRWTVVHVCNTRKFAKFKKIQKNVGINLTIILFCLKRRSDDVKYIGYNRRPILICLFQTKSKKQHFH